MSAKWDVIVIGAGVVGSAAAWRLAGRGRRTLLLEQLAIGHDRGSSHGPSRIIRLSYDEALYTERMPRSYELWHELEKETGTKLVHRVGGLDLGSPAVDSWKATRQTLERFHIPFDELDREQLGQRFPQFAVPEDERGLWQADTGILPADRCVKTLVEAARERGAAVRSECPVVDIRPAKDGVTIGLGSEELSADHVVVAAGAWTRSLLAAVGLDLPLEVTREQVVYFRPRDPASHSSDRFPVFIRHEEELIYGFPTFEGDLVKVALHHAGPVTTAETRDFEPHAPSLAKLVQWVRDHLSGVVPDPVRVETCLYTNTPDRNFILDVHPEQPRIAIGAGFSGHGFKFGTWAGEELARLVETDEPKAPHPRFALHQNPNGPIRER